MDNYTSSSTKYDDDDKADFQSALDTETSDQNDDINNRNIFYLKINSEQLRLQLKKFMATSWMGFIWDISFLFLSTISTISYVISTYFDHRIKSERDIKDQMELFELILSVLFGVDWLLSFFMADQKNEFVGSFYSMVDLLSVIPTFFLYGTGPPPYLDDINSINLVLIYALHAATTARVLRALRIRNYLMYVKDQIQQKVGEIILISLVTLVFFSALMQFFERVESSCKDEILDNCNPKDDPELLDFNVWIYAMLVTISTVGYGEITPATTMGKISVMFMIAFGVMGLPLMSNQLFEKMRYMSYYARLSYNKKKNQNHVIITGDLQSVSLFEFFSEMFHEDHDNDDLNAVVLTPNSPSRDMLAVLRHPQFTLNVTFLEGSALNELDLRRAHADTASAVFILSNKFTQDPDQEDARVILQRFAMTRFVYREKMLLSHEKFNYNNHDNNHNFNINNISPVFCMQLNRAQNMRHMVDLEAPKDLQSSTENDSKDLVVCLNEVKMGIIANNIIYPGNFTLLFNLLMSFSDEGDNNNNNNNNDDDDNNNDDSNDDDDIESLEDDEVNDWRDEYLSGCDWEIYTTEINKAFCGLDFAALSYTIYQKLGITLFGIQLTDLASNHKEVLLNPYNFKIPSSDEYHVEGFVIAKDKKASDLSVVDHGASNIILTRKDSDRVRTLAVVAQALQSLASMNEQKKRSNSNYLASISENTNNYDGNNNNMISPDNRINKLKIESILDELNSDDDSGSDDTISEPDPESFHNNKKQIEWLKLRRRIRKSDMNTKEQEKLLSLELKYRQQIYYVYDQPIELYRVTVIDWLKDDFPTIDNHCIIISKTPTNLFDLIAPMRAKKMKRLQPIVIMSTEDIPGPIWQQISMFQGLYFIKGHPLRETDLLRAGVLICKQVVLVVSAAQNQNSTPTDIERNVVVDSDAIFTFQCVRNLNTSAELCVEMVHDYNVSFIDSNESGPNIKMSPEFVAGMVFTSSLLDTLCVQSFYNPDIIKIVNALVAGNSSKLSKVEDYEEALLRHAQDEYHNAHSNSSDHNHNNHNNNNNNNSSTSSNNNSSTSSNDIEEKHDSLNHHHHRKEKHYIHKDINGAELYMSSQLHQISLPDGLQSRTYGALYKLLYKRGQIPLAIMRGIFKNRGVGSRGNSMRYCFTNPSYDMEIFSCDQIVILSSYVPERRDVLRAYQRQQRQINSSSRQDEDGVALDMVSNDFDMFRSMQSDMKTMMDTVQNKCKALQTTVNQLIENEEK